MWLFILYGMFYSNWKNQYLKEQWLLYQLGRGRIDGARCRSCYGYNVRISHWNDLIGCTSLYPRS